MSDRSALALQLTDAIGVAHGAVQHAGDRAFKAYGLSHRAHAVLSAVDLGGPDGARPKDIASQLGVSRAAATTFIQRLETKGLVETTPDPEDDRGIRVTLTRHGLEVLLRAGQLERRLAARGAPSRDSPRPASPGRCTCCRSSSNASRTSRSGSSADRAWGSASADGGGLRVCVSLCMTLKAVS